MADKVRPSYPALYDAIKAKLWEARNSARDGYLDEPGVATLLGATEAVELFLNWHMPASMRAGTPQKPWCDTCTGENIVNWPCEYTLKIARYVGIEVDRG